MSYTLYHRPDVLYTFRAQSTVFYTLYLPTIVPYTL